MREDSHPKEHVEGREEALRITDWFDVAEARRGQGCERVVPNNHEFVEVAVVFIVCFGAWLPKLIHLHECYVLLHSFLMLSRMLLCLPAIEYLSEDKPNQRAHKANVKDLSDEKGDPDAKIDPDKRYDAIIVDKHIVHKVGIVLEVVISHLLERTLDVHHKV